MNDDGIRDETGNLKVESFIKSLGNSAVSEEVVFFEEVSKAECKEGDNCDDWHGTREGQAHEDQVHDLGIVTFKFKFFREEFLFHLSLNFFSTGSTVSYLLADAVVKGHGESGMENQNDGVEDDLVAD